MALGIPAFLLPHTADIEPYEGNGATGPVYGAKVTVRCYREDKRRLVRAQNGSQVISETTLYCQLDTVAPPESRVTVSGRTTTVITAASYDAGALPVPAHVEVNLA